ncbi:MAG: hypothetical protein NWQ38_16735, partial [Cellulophaga sp.]|nr:hypothetical protein [Cellulophaga sp.]
MMYRSFIYIFFFYFSTSLFGQKPIQNDSVTKLQEVIVLESVLTKKAEGITPSSLIGAKIFQNYSPVDVVSAMNQIP